MKGYFLFSIILAFIFNRCYTQLENNITSEFFGIKSLEISSVSGNFVIEKSYDTLVTVNLISDYKPAKNFKPVFFQENDVLLLKEEMPGPNSGSSDWKLTVPEHINIKFNSASGSITIKKLTGVFKLNTASGFISAKQITISDQSEFHSASGSVYVSLKNTPEFDIDLSSASGAVTLDLNGNPVSGNIEMRAREKLGKIMCPLKFDIIKEEFINDQKYIVKSRLAKNSSPVFKIYTASGIAILIK